MERFFGNFWEKFKHKENKLDIQMTDGSKALLKSMTERPNPNLSEFAFLGLGHGETIDEILVADENTFINHDNSGGFGIPKPGVSKLELILLFSKLEKSERSGDLLLFGHAHPIGVIERSGRYFWIAPSENLLNPSTGDPKSGITNKNDLGFIKWLYNDVVNVPYSGIVAVTGNGTKIRIYDNQKLLAIRRHSDLDKVPQKTIIL